jgi:hypothetical protein
MRSLLFWDFKRGSWQYDVIVILILSFIFLTPREIFRDQPRATSVVRMEPEAGSDVYFLEPEVLSDTQEAAHPQAAAGAITKKFGKSVVVNRVEPIKDSEETLRGYLAYVKR